jgi:hypothetical protein
MSYIEAAVQVLQTADQPLTAAQITEEAIRRGLLASHGKTPAQSMAATLYVYMKHAESGRQSRKLGPARLRRVYVPGEHRARRSTVRWTIE